jgi:hypothetical protein
MSQPPVPPPPPPPYQPQPPYPQPAPAPGTTHVYVNPQPTNGLGVAGFITSLVGIVSCGVLAPIGLILSLIALTRRPRGFAFAGTVIGLIGCIVLAVWTVSAVLGLMKVSGGVKQMAEGLQTMGSARKAVEQIEARRGADGTPLPEADATAIVEAATDAWGTPLRYVADEAAAAAGGATAYTIVSAGRDRQFNTDDDIRMSGDELKATLGKGNGIEFGDD